MTISEGEFSRKTMAIERVADMSLDDLQAFVDRAIDRRMQALLKPRDNRSVKEINDAIRKLRWTPPADAPSNLELLREDRDH
jgi:hypothetical protein